MQTRVSTLVVQMIKDSHMDKDASFIAKSKTIKYKSAMQTCSRTKIHSIRALSKMAYVTALVSCISRPIISSIATWATSSMMYHTVMVKSSGPMGARIVVGSNRAG